MLLAQFHLSYHLAVASSLDVGYLFLVGSTILLSLVPQQLVVVLVLLQGENSQFRIQLFPAQTGILHHHLLLHNGPGKDGMDEIAV